MNVDVFQNDPSWVYYVYLSIPLFVVILSLYILAKNKRRIIRALSYVLYQLLGRLSSNSATDEERAMAVDDENSEEILRWAASAGRADIIRTIGQPLNALSTKPSQRGTPLLLAIKNEHQDIAEFLIPKTKSLDAVDEGGATALHWAAKHGMTRISEQLISKGANRHIKDKNGMDAQAWAKKGENRTLRLGPRATAISGWQTLIEPEQQPLGDIFPAVEIGDLAEINLLNGNGESLELRDPAGRTALFRAITSKQLDALGLLISLGANINAIDNQGFTPLHVAAQEGYREAAQVLIDRGADVSARSNSRLTPLLLADTVEHLPILRILVERGADINAIDDASTTIVHIIAKKPKPHSATLYHFLVLHHAELDKKDNARDTPAHLAACFGNTEFILFLKEKRKDIEHCRNRAGVTPLMVAVEKDQVVVVKLLMEMGISPNVRGHGSSLPLSMTLWECAVWWGKAEILSILEQSGATCTAKPDPDDPGGLEQSALHPIWHAIAEKHTAVVLQLIDTGRCDVSMVKFGKVSMLYHAANTSNAELVKGLLERGANPNAVDWYGWTPLHSAAFSGNAQITAAFIQQANDIWKLDEQGWTALDLATFYRHWDVVDLLDPGRTVKVFPWQMPKETRYCIVNGQRRRYSWTPDVQESAQGRAEVP
jgi:ankyrin repeat protein